MVLEIFLRHDASLDAKKDPLVELDAIVSWEEFRSTLERVWRKPAAKRRSQRAGRKPMDAVVMFKTLVLNSRIVGVNLGCYFRVAL